MLAPLLLLLAAQAATDPVAPARSGMLQCYVPDLEKKRCMAIGSLVPMAEGKWRYVSTIRLSEAPLLTLETASTLTVEGDAICGLVLREDFMNGTVQLEGAALPPEQARPILEQIIGAFASMIGKKACSRLRQDGGALLSETTLDGVAHPELNQTMAWVRPEDGYRVGR